MNVHSSRIVVFHSYLTPHIIGTKAIVLIVEHEQTVLLMLYQQTAVAHAASARWE